MAFLFCALQTFAQNNFTYSPEKPHAGDVITINYSNSKTRPAATSPNEKSSLTAIVYTLGSKGQTANDLSLKKTGDTYTATVKTDTS